MSEYKTTKIETEVCPSKKVEKARKIIQNAIFPPELAKLFKAQPDLTSQG